MTVTVWQKLFLFASVILWLAAGFDFFDIDPILIDGSINTSHPSFTTMIFKILAAVITYWVSGVLSVRNRDNI